MQCIITTFVLLLTLTNAVLTFIAMTKNQAEWLTKFWKKIFFFGIGVSVLSLLLAVMGISGVQSFHNSS
ncbi:MAG: hypothetical protein IJU14_07265, partial [Clostridia bacterium]|nr:hypothetical protein [Clostridia bacterium]